MSHSELVSAPISAQEVQSLLSIVGRDGAISALAASDRVNVSDLLAMSKAVGAHPRARDSKRVLARQLVRHIDRRITKPLGELKKMTAENVEGYLRSTNCDSDEIIELLEQIDQKTQKRISREALIKFAAVQISSLGIFERLSRADA